MDNPLHTSGFVVQPRLNFKNLIDKMLYQHFVDAANYQSSKKCDRGQLIISALKLSEETGWTRGMIRGSIKRLSDAGYITSTALTQNRGLLITILSYDDYQNLGNYSKKINQRENQQENQQANQREESEIPCGTRSGVVLKKEDNQRSNQQENQRQNHTLTAYINSIININKTLKEYIAEANLKSLNLVSAQDIETFVDFASRTNALPQGVNHRILVLYFDSIRLSRQTCTISANILVKFIDKIQKYSANQINYALWKHIEDHDDKRESYTLGILRNVKEPEARRGLIKLKNRQSGWKDHEGNERYPTAVGENESSTSKETQRLQELARQKGLAKGGDVNFDF
ncbi:hypothetical protein ACFVSW_20030 [Neobacillus sp. NPDC058068]|uniref:hypothetical protein n=1 Tax=Neobacillus sp. NPDC058068 TaxID=3346325 RepID=UPI0036DC5311